MSPVREFSRLSEPAQWLRCRHEGTGLLDDGHGIELAWSEPAPDASPPQRPPVEPAGLAFDRWGRAYRSEPEDGRVVVLPRQPRGPRPHRPGALDRPRGIAVDAAQRLYVADAGRRRVLVVDLWAQRLLRAVPMASGAPVDVAADGYGVLALVEQRDGSATLVALRGRRGPIPAGVARPPSGASGLRPARLVCHPTAGPLVLWRAVTGPDAVVCDPWGTRVLAVPGATDVEVDGAASLVVARGAGSPLRVWRDDAGEWVALEPLAAPGHDGAAIACDLEGTIAYTTERGVARTAGSAATYRPTGRLLSYRLDAGQYRARWGRVFLDACIPAGTSVRMAFLTSDDDDVLDPLPAAAPGGVTPGDLPDGAPPLPSAAAVSRLPRPLDQAVLRRPTGRERPWEQIASDDGYDTYETTAAQTPGRYLWLVAELTGTANASPRIREVRVERAGHRLDRQLPRSWSRDELDASFLHRFLAPAEGMLRDLDDRAAERAALLDPHTAPAEALEWLASFLGLVVDRRWPLAARRGLVAEAYDLFRLRGTRAALEEVLRLYLGRRVDIVENWRLRGLGGTTLGPPASGRTPPFVAEAGRAVEPLGSFIVGGALPDANRVLADSDVDTAHRFTVILPQPLDLEQRAVVASVLEAHKPAHTQADICEFAGMRIGRLRVGLTSFVAADSFWGPEVAGQTLLGTDGVVGVPDVAARVGDTAIGRVRVG